MNRPSIDLLTPMLVMKMQETSERLPVESRLSIAAQAREIQQVSNSREALGFLIRKLGIDLTSHRDEQYFSEALDFHTGLIEAFADRPEEMSRHIALSRTMPASDDELLYSDHVATSTIAKGRQLGGISTGKFS